MIRQLYCLKKASQMASKSLSGNRCTWKSIIFLGIPAIVVTIRAFVNLVLVSTTGIHNQWKGHPARPALPVSIPSGSVGIVADRLVKDSFEYTFNRPVGDFDYELGAWGKEAPPSSENSGPAAK